MTTSSFRIAGKHHRAVAISRGVPTWFKGRVYMPLAPCWPLVRVKDPERFTRVYTEKVLAKLDPYRVIAELGERSVMLCWEAPGQFCHRQLVASWIRRETGLRVREWRG